MLRSPHTNRNCHENQNSNKSVWCCIFVTIFLMVAVLALGHGLDISKCLRLSLNNTGVIYIVPLPDMDYYYYYFSEVSSAASIKPFRESSVSLYIVVSRALEHTRYTFFVKSQHS